MNRFIACQSAVNRTTGRLCRAIVCLTVAAAPIMAMAQAGQLDTTFGTNGIFASTFSNSAPFATCVALQSNGLIIVGGEAGNPGIIVRLNTNGTIDTSFGTNGVVSIRYADVENFTVGVAVQPADQKILAVGTGLPGRGQLVRLNPDGSMDTTFGQNGSVILSATPSVLALQPDGNILVNGATANNTPVLMRYTSTGQIDTTFGSGGMAPLFASPAAIALQANGQILVGSGSPLGLNGSPSSLSRYNTDGSVDIFFGVQGQIADLVGPSAVGVQSNGQIITAGTAVSGLSLSGNSTGFGLTGSFPSGFPDILFGTHGGAVTPFPNFPATTSSSLAIQTNNFIVAAGSAGISAHSSEFALARYAPNGQLDNSFGTAGLVTTSFGNGTTASIAAVTLQSDGKIVVVGQASNSGFVVARYLGQ